jgi:hypothetical protein
MISRGSMGTYYAIGVPSINEDYVTATKNVALMWSFPCDFDYLTDVLNGIDENGESTNSLAAINPLFGSMSLFGNQQGSMGGCGIGGSNFKVATTNYGSAEQQNSCNVGVEKHLLKRQARMSLLERDKIALRLVTPWNHMRHVGEVITFDWRDTERNTNLIYGSGDYLITSLTHTIRLGGLSTTTYDCISQTALRGA